MYRSLYFSALFVLALAAGARGQSSAGSFATLSYSFGLDSDSLPFESDLIIDDQGLQTYNLIVPFNPATGADNSAYYSPYFVSSGNGSAFAEVDSGTYFDLSGQTGYAGVDSYAQRNPDGTADASVGTQETMVIYNNGQNDVTYNVSAVAQAMGLASATGADRANVDTYVGIYSFDFSTSTGINPLIHIFGPAGAVTTSATPEWVAQGSDAYRADFDLTVRAGTSRSLAFYTSSINRTAAPVPEPASIAALGVGAVAMLRRRRRA